MIATQVRDRGDASSADHDRDEQRSSLVLQPRWYDPTPGVFNRLDPYEGDPRNPVSLNKYQYTYANPISGIDPTGWGFQGTASSSFNQLASDPGFLALGDNKAIDVIAIGPSSLGSLTQISSSLRSDQLHLQSTQVNDRLTQAPFILLASADKEKEKRLIAHEAAKKQLAYHQKQRKLITRELNEVVDRATDEMQREKWKPKNPKHDGAFGNEVHRRASIAMQGRKGWAVDVYVDDNTQIVKSIGSVPKGGVKGTTQVDVARLVRRYTPKVGQKWDESRAYTADIKTSINKGLSDDQEARLQSLSADGQVSTVKSVRVYSVRKGWHVNHKLKRAGQALVAIGVVSSAYAIVNVSAYDHEFNEMADAIEDYRTAEQGAQRRLAGLNANAKITAYLERFLPESDPLHAASYINKLKVLTAD